MDIAYSPTRGLIDHFGGEEDIRKGVIRCVGDPATRFREDALRMMRGIRFASALGFRIEEETAAAIHENKERIPTVSAERIQVELTKLLCGVNVKNVLMDWWDVLGVVIPEILPMHGFDQKTPYHIYDVWEHTAVAVSKTPPVTHLRLSALLHDIGKPATFFTDEKGIGHFYGHPAVSARMAEEILTRLKYDNVTRRRVVTLVREHDRIIEEKETAVKRALSRLTPEVFFNLLIVGDVGILAHGYRNGVSCLSLVVEALAVRDYDFWGSGWPVWFLKPCVDVEDHPAAVLVHGDLIVADPSAVEVLRCKISRKDSLFHCEDLS